MIPLFPLKTISTHPETWKWEKESGIQKKWEPERDLEVPKKNKKWKSKRKKGIKYTLSKKTERDKKYPPLEFEAETKNLNLYKGFSSSSSSLQSLVHIKIWRARAVRIARALSSSIISLFFFFFLLYKQRYHSLSLSHLL